MISYEEALEKAKTVMEDIIAYDEYTYAFIFYSDTYPPCVIVKKTGEIMSLFPEYMALSPEDDELITEGEI